MQLAQLQTTNSYIQRFNSVQHKEVKQCATHDTEKWQDAFKVTFLREKKKKKKASGLLEPNDMCNSVPRLCLYCLPFGGSRCYSKDTPSHFSAVQYCKTEPPSCIPSGSDPFSYSQTSCTRI